MSHTVCVCLITNVTFFSVIFILLAIIMITSTTDILSQIVEVSSQNQDAGLISQSSQQPAVTQQIRKQFTLRYGCMQSWFIRSSWINKMKCLTHLLEGLKSIDSLGLILNTLRVTCSKSTAYGSVQYTTNFIYDKTLQDHNRSLHKTIFEETQESDLEWFKTLQDSEQILILIGLIRIGGGGIMHPIYERGAKMYHQRVEKMSEPQRVSMIKIKTEATLSNTHIPTTPNNSSFIEQCPTVGPTIFKIAIDDEPKRDPTDPFVIEMEKQKKAWNDMITKYRIQVEGKPPKPVKEKKGSKSAKSAKSSKSEKSKKGGKSGKDSKSSKGKKGKKGKGEGDAIDYVQFLPIWIVKQIFSYLDAKTLKKIKAVNKYWAYAIADMLKEQKARKNLDKFIRKMEASVASSEMQLAQTPERLQDVADDKKGPKKRLINLAERGATLPKLKGKFKPPLIDTCLVTDAVNMIPEKYILPVTQLDTFPRNAARSANLYKIPSCMINELGFTKINFEEEDNDEDVFPLYTAKLKDTLGHHSNDNRDNSEEEIKVISYL